MFRVALAVGLGIATVLLMDLTNTAYFGWYRWVQRSQPACACCHGCAIL